MLISYDEYKENGGSLNDAAFKVYGYEAERKLMNETHGRINKVTEPIARCLVRLTDILSKCDVAQDKVTSWSNDGISQSVKDVSAEEYADKTNAIIREYLSDEFDEKGVPLLYLGVDA